MITPAHIIQATVSGMTGMTEKQAELALTDRITRAFLADGFEQELALDFNARLVTELREARIWPGRKGPQHPCEEPV